MPPSMPTSPRHIASPAALISSKKACASVALVALSACASPAADEATAAATESDLTAACDLGTTCAGTLPLLAARSFGYARPPADLVADLELGDRRPGLDRTPRRFAQATSAVLTYSEGPVLLSSDADAFAPIWADDVLLFEMLDATGANVLAQATFGGIALRRRGVAIQQLTPQERPGVGSLVDLASVLPRRLPFRLRVTALDVAGRAETTAVYLRPESLVGPGVPAIDFTWSWNGRPRTSASHHCIQIQEPAYATTWGTTGEPADARTRRIRDAWSDNHLCTNRDFGLRWSFAGPIAGMVCTNIDEPAAPAEHTWADNYLCAPRDYRLVWSSAGAHPGHACTRIFEPDDPFTWNDNYLCQDRR